MSSAPTTRDVIIALLLSLTFTLISAIIYAFYPAIAVAFETSWGRGGPDGIGAVAGGLIESFIWASLLLWPALFLIIFVLLQRRRVVS